jgi:hypothetical protein
MKDYSTVFEFTIGRTILAMHISKPWYSLWYTKDKTKIYLLFGVNYVKQPNCNGIQLIVWGINILFAWSNK